MTIELYHNDMSSCAQKVRAQLAEKGPAWSGHALNLRTGEQHQPAFLALNPKGVVPVLIHDGAVVTESNIIMEYIEDAFADAGPQLRPAQPQARAKMRAWMQKLDAGLHLDIAVLSIGVAFRHQLMAVHQTPDQLEGYYAAIPDRHLRNVYRSVVPHGPASEPFKASLAAWQQALEEAEAALEGQGFLASNTMTLADLAILPYLLRLEHLQLGRLWSQLPRTAAWLERMKATDAYRIGIEQWLNPKYLEIMAQKGVELNRELGAANP